MKPKRDITLGEMKDECDKNHKNATPCGFCVYKDVCSYKQQHGLCWIDLTDPPRFTEAQMAFLRGCYRIGIVGLLRNSDGMRTHFLTKFGTIGYLTDKENTLSLAVGETLDLAELFRKERGND